MFDNITGTFTVYDSDGITSAADLDVAKNELKNWAKKIKIWQKKGFDVYAYFNNDALGHAVENAQTLKELCLKKR